LLAARAAASAVARTKALDAKQHVSKGDNPSTAKRIAKANQVIKGEATFGAIAREWLDHNKPGWSTHHFERNDGLLKRYLLPDLERLPIDSIKEAYLFTVIKAVYDKGTKESARRARAVAAQVFSHARATHRGTINPARDMADNPYFKKPPVKHFTALPQNQVGALINELDKTGVEQKLDAKTVCALRLALYTGLRDNSIRGALWREIDFDNAVWTIPSTRMKSGTAQKMVLNMISTAVMIKLGRIKGNKMVNMQLTNQKLFDRGVKMIVDELDSIDVTKAAELLSLHGSVKKSIEAFQLK
jgi:integrase